MFTNDEKVDIAARIAAIKAKLDTLNQRVQLGAILSATGADFDVAHDITDLLITVAFAAASA